MMEEVVQMNSADWPRHGYRNCVIANGHYLYKIGCNGATETEPCRFQVWKFNTITLQWSKVYDDATGRSESHFSEYQLIRDRLLMVTDKFELSTLLLQGSTRCQQQSPEKFRAVGAVPLEHEWIKTDLYPVPDRSGQFYRLMCNEESVLELWLVSVTAGTNQQRTTVAWTKQQLENEVLYDQDCPKPMATVLYDNKLYLIPNGVRQEGSWINNDFVNVLDLDKKIWTKVGTVFPDNGQLPAANSCFSWAQHKDVVYMVGGHTREGARDVTDQIWSLNLSTNKWDRLPIRLPTPLENVECAITADGCLYVFGGRDASGSASNRLYKLWIQPPTLKMAALQQLLKTNPQLTSATQGQLIAYGIPRDMIKYMQDQQEQQP